MAPIDRRPLRCQTFSPVEWLRRRLAPDLLTLCERFFLLMLASLNEKHRSWIEDYQLIENPLERLNALVDRSKRFPALPESAKIEANRVQGCVSQVWVIGRLDEAGHCVFEAEADSILVRGLVRTLCELYSGRCPE